MVCTSLGSLLRPLFYFLCSNLKANPVLTSHFMFTVWISLIMFLLAVLCVKIQTRKNILAHNIK